MINLLKCYILAALCCMLSDDVDCFFLKNLVFLVLYLELYISYGVLFNASRANGIFYVFFPARTASTRLENYFGGSYEALISLIKGYLNA